MQELVLLKWTIGLVPERSTRMMAFTIIARWSWHKKWLSVKNRISEKHGIQVSFSDKHNFYLSAYTYVCKSDQEVAGSENHPAGLLTAASSQTKKSIAGFCTTCAEKRNFIEVESSCAVAKKQKSLGNLDLAEFIRKRGIRSYAELLAFAEGQRTASQMDIAEFLFQLNEKTLRDFVTKTWQMESAKEKLEASKASRIDTVKIHLTSDCVEGCSGRWLRWTKEDLLLNGIDTFQFVNRIKDLLIHGRGKNRNLIITWPTNSAKTFMLKTLKLVLSDSIFENSAIDKYAWVGSEKAKVSLLNDLMAQRLDPLAWYAAFAWRRNCKTFCSKEHLQWRYCDLNWCG